MRCIPAVALSLALIAATPADAASGSRQEDVSAVPTEFSAQAQPRRVRPRIRVTPRYYPYRTFASPYPLPYEIEYPGPGAVRDCQARLVPEARPSGTVIVPRMRCAWVRR